MQVIQLSILLNLIILLNVTGQNTHSVTIEDQQIILPNRYSIKINCVATNILNKSWMKEESYLSKDSVLQILNAMNKVEIKEDTTSSTNASSKYLDILYVEVTGNDAFRNLKSKIGFRTPMMVEEYHVKNFEQHENSLVDKMLKEAHEIATKELQTQGKKIVKLLNYKEIDESNKMKESRDDQLAKGGFAVLKEKFIEANYKGYPINELGQILCKKKLNVNFEID